MIINMTVIPAVCLGEKSNSGTIRIDKKEMQQIINNIYPIVLTISLFGVFLYYLP
jgi:hypothetical protein